VKYRGGMNSTQRARGRQVCMKGNKESKRERVKYMEDRFKKAL
jgi:hypothetical protein